MYGLKLIEDSNQFASNLNSVAEVFINIREHAIEELHDIEENWQKGKDEVSYYLMPNDFNIDNPKLAETEWFYITVVFVVRREGAQSDTPVWANVYAVSNEP